MLWNLGGGGLRSQRDAFIVVEFFCSWGQYVCVSLRKRLPDSEGAFGVCVGGGSWILGTRLKGV